MAMDYPLYPHVCRPLPAVIRMACGMAFCAALAFGLCGTTTAQDAGKVDPGGKQDTGAGESILPAPDVIDRILSEMEKQGRSFRPDELLKLGVPGLLALLDRIFPGAGPEGGLSGDRVRELIGQLGDDSFERRESATALLKIKGKAHADLVRKATEQDDLETRFRAKAILQAWRDQVALQDNRRSRLRDAMYAYTKKLTDVRCHGELAIWAVRALAARVDRTPESKILEICIMALARCHDDSVHKLLLPLLKHKDPAVPCFAMRAISGRTGNSYIAPIHMGALQSSRKELIKCALRSMPCPIWDRRKKAAVRAVYEKIFEGKDPAWNFDDDSEFMMLNAFVAARDFSMKKARVYLRRAMGNPDPKIALDAIGCLADIDYIGTTLDPEILEALEPHLRSEGPRFRRAALHMLHYYKGEDIVGRLVKALGDKDPSVWKGAGRYLVDRYSYYREEHDKILRMLRKALEGAESDAMRERVAYILKFMETTPEEYFDWEEEEEDR